MITRSHHSALLQARSALRKALALHLASVSIGRYERIHDTGVIDAEIDQARDIIQEMDVAMAEIDKLLPQTQRK